MQTNILLYDDNKLLRESIEALIKEDPAFNITSMPNAQTIEADLADLKPNVILMDIDMPQLNGVEAVKRIRKMNVSLPVIMLTVFDDNENIFNAICAGASGYLLKRYAAMELHAAIKNVLSGGAPMTGSVAKKVLQMVPQAKTAEAEIKDLSKRETQILQLLVQGYSYKMIASELKITHDTVRFHIKRIYDKLHVHTAVEAVSKVIKEKLL
jgi:DNA-binding NarL/FixJ family response regulator